MEGARLSGVERKGGQRVENSGPSRKGTDAFNKSVL